MQMGLHTGQALVARTQLPFRAQACSAGRRRVPAGQGPVPGLLFSSLLCPPTRTLSQFCRHLCEVSPECLKGSYS